MPYTMPLALAVIKIDCNSGSRFKPALVLRNVRFKTVLLNTIPRDSMKSTAEPGLGQGLKSDEHRPV